VIFDLDAGHQLTGYDIAKIEHCGGTVFDLPDRAGYLVCFPEGVLSTEMEPIAEWEAELMHEPNNLFTHAYAGNKWENFAVAMPGATYHVISLFFAGERVT